MKHALILATTNPKKIEKLSEIFAPYFDDIQPQNITLGVGEDGDRAETDAAIRAVAASLRYNCPAVATNGDESATVAIANHGKLLFSEEVTGQNDTAAWEHLKAMVDWYLQPN